MWSCPNNWQEHLSLQKYRGYFYLLWGWLIVSASLIHYGLLDLDQPLFIGGIWIIALTIGVIASYIVGKRRAKQTQVRPYTLDLVLYLWIGLGSCFFLILGMAFTATLTFEIAYPLFMMLYGLGAFISGGVLVPIGGWESDLQSTRCF